MFSTINFPGANATIASGISSNGEIVGYYVAADGMNYGFLDSGGVFTTIQLFGSPLTQAYGINDRGDIVGSYFSNTSTGATSGFVLTPSPEPSLTIFLVVASAFLVVIVRWKAKPHSYGGAKRKPLYSA